MLKIINYAESWECDNKGCDEFQNIYSIEKGAGDSIKTVELCFDCMYEYLYSHAKALEYVSLSREKEVEFYVEFHTQSKLRHSSDDLLALCKQDYCTRLKTDKQEVETLTKDFMDDEKTEFLEFMGAEIIEDSRY